jgi:hypothetical protein
MNNKISIKAFNLICKSLGSEFEKDARLICKISEDFVIFDKNQYEAIRKKHIAQGGVPTVAAPPTEHSLLHKASLLANSIAPWAINGFKLVDKETLEKRLDICKGCEFWDQSGFVGTGKCKKCGCSTQAKLRMDTSKCPIDKWGPIEVVKTD